MPIQKPSRLVRLLPGGVARLQGIYAPMLTDMLLALEKTK